jgi:hypothetical protein
VPINCGSQVNLALADGYIGSFETKYHYRYWRPVTAIHNAGTDGNPPTEPDPGWAPLGSTRRPGSRGVPCIGAS